MLSRPPLVFLSSLLCCALISACAATPKTQRPARPAAASHTVAVPAADDPLGQGLQASLTDRGWSLMQYDPSALADNRGYQRLSTLARYRMTLSSKRIGDCRNGDASYLYNVAVIENDGGGVIAAMTGAQCRETAIERFGDELDRKRFSPPASGPS
ncbi:hypothetical protein [Salinisphaera sp. T31B1]|uniref:hypothetical protein n=1 Tax=Salinisphaera sp. T31B1 TaxID=727963 RepID=UPI003341D831